MNGYHTDLMIDLETLGTAPGCVITQIGLSAFDARPQSGGTAAISSTLINVHPQSCLDKGMHVSWGTIAWWLTQEENARVAMAMKTGYELYDALHQTTEFINLNCHEDVCVWGNGSTFDVTLIEDAYRRVKLTPPWSFRNIRDLRTLAGMKQADGVRGLRPVPKVAHNAMDDASAQAAWVQILYRAIEKGSDV